MTYEEYLKIKEESDRLNRLVYEYEHKVVDLSTATIERPINRLMIKNRNVDDINEVELIYVDTASDIPWKCFSQLAKYIHQSPVTYYMSTEHPKSHKPYVRECENAVTYPRRYSDMTEDQIKISGQMVEEMIKVWNKYFKKINKKAYLLHGVSKRTEIEVKEQQ